MLKKILAMTLVVLMITSSLMVNFATPGNGKANGLENGNGNNGKGNAFGYGHGGYDDEEASEWYYYGNGTDFARLDKSTEGQLMVQYYNVSDISWKSNSSRELWTRSNMFSENRVVGSPVLRSVDEHNGYGDYYDDYIFYKNGSYTEGSISKTAQRIWGYYKPDETGYYKFRVTSDDGHYFKIFNDDIFNNPAYDHYNDGTYANQWNRFYNNGQLELDNMIITSNVAGTTEWRYMRENEIYPVYMEYFNWGGSGKFEFEEAYSEYNPNNNPQFDEVDDDNLFARIISETSQNGESGIDITVDNGVRTVHAYDDFDDGVIDSDVWSNINRFYESSGTLNSYSGLASIQLKNEYADYDAYKIQVSLVNIDDQTMKYSNGGIGVSDGNSIWVNQLQVTQKDGRKWYRYFDVTKYGTVNHQLPNGERYKSTFFDMKKGNFYKWLNKSLKMVVDAEKLETADGYDVTVSIYSIEDDDFKLLTTVTTTTDDSKLDFNKIYLADIMPYGGWYVSFDDFDFVAVKDTRFTSLILSHKNDDYILEWQPVEGADKYIVYYGDNEEEVGTKYDGDIDASTTTLSIPDYLTAYNSKYFKIVAVMSDREIGSNTVKLNGDVSMSTLQGRFDESDYLLSWDRLVGADKYQLYFGETPTSIETLLPGSENMNPNTMSKKLENMDSTSPYYNMYFQLRAIDDDLVYYSNAVKVEDNLRLGLEHRDDTYYLKWISDSTFTSYDIYYGDSKSSITTKYRNVGRDVREFLIDDGGALNDKFFKIIGKSGSRSVSSNHIELNGDVTIAPLTWRYTDSGEQLLNWGGFDTPEIMTLYYGDEVDAITTVMSKPENLPNGTTQYTTNEMTFLNKYIQLKFVKEGVSYYTNIVRSAQFSDASGTVKPSVIEVGQKDLLVEWVNDSQAIGYEVRYKEPGANGEGSLIIGDLAAGTDSYTIKDIYGVNKIYLNREIFVVAKYENDIIVASQPVTANEIIFDSFVGVLDTNSNFKMTWELPILMKDGGEQDLTAEYYTIKYGNSNAIVNQNVVGADVLDDLNYQISNVRNESNSSGHAYYDKYFIVSAYIDGIAYESNVIRSLPQNKLSVSHENDKYVLNWDEVPGAIGYKIYYGDTEVDQKNLYGDVLGSNKFSLEISDLDNVSEKHFKVLAVLGDGTTIPSNVVQLRGDQVMSVLAGVMNNSDYDLSWTAFDAADSFTLVYMDAIGGEEKEIIGIDPLSNSTLKSTIENISTTDYNNKYIRLIAKKDGIEFKSNIVRSSRFAPVSGTILDNGDRKDFTFNWDKVEGAIDYVVYYQDENSTWIEYPENLDEDSRYIEIEDIAGSNVKYNNKKFKVEAIFAGGVKVSSDSVKPAVEAGKPLLKGNFTGNDYVLLWDGITNAERYDIYYGQKVDNVNALIPTGTNLSGTTSTLTLYDVITSDYLNGYYLVKATKDGVTYTSNLVRSSRFAPVSGTILDNGDRKDFTFNWDKVEGAIDYVVYYQDENSTWIEYPENLDEDSRYIEIEDITGSNVKYNNKKFKVEAIFASGVKVSSDTVKPAGETERPTLVGRFIDGDDYLLSWTRMPGADSYDVVYGDSATGEMLDVPGATGLNPNNLSKKLEDVVASSPYLNKYFKVKAKKDGVYYDSTVVTSRRFEGLTGTVVDNDDAKDFVLNWQEVSGATKYVVYYTNDAGDAIVKVDDDVKTNTLTIQNVVLDSDFGKKHYYVEAVFEGDVRVESNKVILDLNNSISLEGILNEDNTLVLNWTGLTNGSGYRILYGGSSDSSTMLAIRTDLLSVDTLTETLIGVSNNGAGKNYYHKYFVVQGKKDGVYYNTNIVYSGEKPVLSIEKYGTDDFKLHWPKIENATSIIVNYKGEDDTTYEKYLDSLTGNATNVDITDVLSENAKYNKNVFRIIADFNGYKIESNDVFLSTDIVSPTIVGRYADGDYKITWESVENARSIEIIHVNREGDDNVLEGKYIVDTIAGDETSFTISDAKSSSYYTEHIQIKVTIIDEGDYTTIVYSNEVFVEEAIIDGTNPTDGGNTVDQPSIEQGEFDGDLVKLRMGNEFEVGYKFVVNDDMYDPYFKVTLQGNQYLSYDKIIAGLYNVETGEKIPVRLVMDVDETTGDIVVYVHPKGDSSKLLTGGEYKVTLDSTIDVVDEDKVYDALYGLPGYDDSVDKTPKKWELPYYISKLYDKSGGKNIKIDHDMHIKYEIEWNSTNVNATSDVRQNATELFDLEVQVKDKRKLPNSI